METASYLSSTSVLQCLQLKHLLGPLGVRDMTPRLGTPGQGVVMTVT